MVNNDTFPIPVEQMSAENVATKWQVKESEAKARAREALQFENKNTTRCVVTELIRIR